MRPNTKLCSALAALAVAAAIVAPAADARLTRDEIKAAAACDQTAVPPPPSSIAASAAKQYGILRACGSHEDRTAVATAPAASEAPPPTSFDWESATIGAIAAGGLSLVLVAALGVPRRTAPAVPR